MNNSERILNDGEDPLSSCNIPLLLNHTGVVYDLSFNIPKPFMNMSFSTQFGSYDDKFQIHLSKNYTQEKAKDILDQINIMFESLDQIPSIEINSLLAQTKKEANHVDELRQFISHTRGYMDFNEDKLTAFKSNLKTESNEMTPSIELNNINEIDISINFNSKETDMARGDNKITPIKKTKKRRASSDIDFVLSNKKIKYLNDEDGSSLTENIEDSNEAKIVKLIQSFKLDDPNHIISYKELNTFCVDIVLMKKKNLLINLSMETLKNIISLFYKHIKNSHSILSINILKNMKNSNENIDNTMRYHELIMVGLSSVVGILITITTDKLDKSVLVEEIIEDSLDFIRNIFKYYLYPLIDECDIEHIVDHSSISLYKLKYYEIMEELNVLTENFSLPDSIIVSLTNLSLSIFFCENMSNSHFVTLNMIKTMFSKYPDHRSIILDDILADITKLKKSKKIVKSYPINHSSRDNMHIISSMFLQIIQSCSDLPPTNEETSSSTYSVALGYSRIISQSFLNMCCKQEEQAIRSLFQSFLEDLLSCINLPEWPASEILLYNISHTLSHFISKKQELGLTHEFVGFCIDNLGLIVAKARKIYQSLNQPEKLKYHLKNQELCPICQKEYEGKFMIQCDGCNFWFHGNCVGKDEISEKWKWFCDYCLVTRKINEMYTMNSYENSDTSLSNTENDTVKDSDDIVFEKVSKVVILNYVLKYSQNNPVLDSARKFWLCQWNIDDQNSDHSNFYRIQWDNTSKGAKWNQERNITEDEFETITYDGIKQLIESLLLKRKLVRSSHSLLKIILQTMKDDIINLRFKSMRALLTIVEADNSLLQDPVIYDSVKCGFNDSSPKVREKSLNLIGQYILMNPELITKYNFILDCLLDKSINVRRRIIKILQAICYMNPSSKMVPQICLKLLSCLNSEDSIRELIFTTFRELWFTEDSSKFSVSDDLFFEFKIENQEFDLQQKINQMLLVITTLYDKKHTLVWIEEIISNTLKRNNFQLIFGKIVEEIIEKLIKLNDNDSLNENERESIMLTPAKLKLSCFQALNIISKLSPSLVVDHIDTIHPFIKQDYNMAQEDSKVIINALNILENVLPHVVHPSTVFLKEIQSDLLKLIWKQGMNVIHGSIKCLCVITQKITKNEHNLHLLYNRMLEYAIKFKNSESIDDKVVKILIRSLYTISLLCKYYDFDDNLKRANFTSFESLRTSKYSDRIENLFKLLSFYKNHKDQSLRLTSIRAIGYLCTYPGILLRAVNIFKSSFNDETNIPVQNQALTSLQEILTEEESKMTELSKLSSTITNKSIDDTKETLDSSATSIVINTLIQSILKLALSKDAKTRLASLLLISKVLKMGIVHPLQCISTIIALETDHVDQIHELAKSILKDFDPTVIQNRLAEGFLLSFEFQTSVYGISRPVREVFKKGEDGRTITVLESSLSTLYEIFVKKKTSCNNFLCSALRLFEVDSKLNNCDALFFQHLILSLATLPFTKEYEILYLIFQINSMNSFQASEAYQNLKRYYENNGVSDLPKKDFNAAISSTYLLILKKFLKEYYGITKEKIFMFNPGDVSKTNLINRLFIQSSDLQLYFPKDIFISNRKWMKDEELRLKVFNMFAKELKLEQEEYMIDEEYIQKRPSTRGKRGKKKE